MQSFFPFFFFYIWKRNQVFLCFELTRGLWLGEDLYSTVSQSDQTPPKCHARRGRGEVTAVGGRGPCPGRRGGRISDDIIMTGFGRFASLLVSSTGASNRTFTTQLSDRRQRTKSVWGERVHGQPCGEKQPQHRATKAKTKWWDVLWKSIKMPWTVSWWKKEWNRGGTRGDEGVMRC